MSETADLARERRVVAFIALAALILRAYIQILTPTIAADSAYYLYSARLMGQGEVRQGLELYGLHPLFPLLVGGLGSLTGLEFAARLISILASSAAVLVLYALLRPTWSFRVAAAACLLYALHPILAEEGSEPLPTGLFLLLFLSALACGLRALRGGPAFLFPLAGALCGLAYLTRTEGLMAALLLAGAAAAAALRPPRRRVLAGAAVALLAGAAISIPYVAELSRKAGRFTITGKGGGSVLLRAVTGQKVDVEAPPVQYAFWSIVPKKLAVAVTALLLPFLAAGLWLERRELRRRLGELSRAALALAPPIALAAISPGYRPSHRYFLAGVTLLLPWMAAAALALLDAAGRRRPWAAGVVGAALVAALLYRNALPERREERAFREAGAWLAACSTDVVVSTSEKLSWYAGARHVPFHAGADPLALCRAAGTATLAVDSNAVDDTGPELPAKLEAAGFTRLADFERGGRRRTLKVWLWRAPER